MDKMALADRFDGYSNVFASDSNIGIDLKAMADTLRSMPEEKFAKVINADFEEDATFNFDTKGPSALQSRTKQMDRKTPAHVPGGIVPTDPQFAGVPKGNNKAKMIAELAKKHGVDIKVVEKIFDKLNMTGVQASMPGVMDTSGPGAYSNVTLHRDRKNPARVPGGINPTDDMFRGVPKGDQAKMIADVSSEFKLDPSTVKNIIGDLNAAFKSKAASDLWTKSASDLIAQNLVRDVLGMDKSICCDTKRHLDKKQMPDATKTQETKGAVARQEDTGAALKPEQVPHLDEVLNSDMYKKSQGKVVKEAATVEDRPDTGAAEPQNINADQTAVENAKRLEKIEDANKKAEAKEKAEKAKELSRPKSKEVKAQSEVEANTVVAEGVEFDNVMMEAEANDEDVKKLSALFE